MSSSTTKKNIKDVKKTLGSKKDKAVVVAEVAEEVAEETCQHIISNGKNKDTPCGKKVVIGTTICSKHTKLDPTAVVDSILEYVKTLLGLEKSPQELTKLLDSKKVKTDIQSIISPKTRKTKKKKDPTRPKTPLNSYMFFTAANRQKIKDANPELKLTEISVKIGEVWRGLSEKKKKTFETMAKKDKDRYDEEMKNYTPSEEWVTEHSKSDSKKTKKRTSTAWELWRKDHKVQIMNDNPEMSPTEKQEEIRRVWSSLTAEEKEPWQSEADRLKEEKKAELSSSDSESETVKKVPKKKKTKKNKKSESESESESDSDIE